MNLAVDVGEGWELGSGGGAFSLEGLGCLRLDLEGVGFGEEGVFSIGSLKIVFLGNMKCFIFLSFGQKGKRERKGGGRFRARKRERWSESKKQ